MTLKTAWAALWAPAATKASAAGPLIAMQSLGRAVWSPRRFDGFAEEGYKRNVIAYRAVNQIARAVASVSWRAFRGSGERRRELEAHPVLALLARPNPTMARAEFVEAVTGYFLIAGNSFVEAVGGGDSARELWPLRPDRMKVVAGAAGLPQGYVYSLGGAERRWDADPVTGRAAILHLKSFHPLDDWYGLSPVEPAASAIDQRNESDKWNMALMQNGARPSGALVYEPKGAANANLSDEQFARLKREVTAQYSGARNAGRPMLLDGGLTWQGMSLSPKDMDFLDARHAAARDIALAFGVPPQLLGIPGDNTYANYREARLALWEDTVIPLLYHLRDEFNAWLVPQFDDEATLEIDLDKVPALAPRRERVWSRVQAAQFLTINEKRRMVGLGAVEGGDTIPQPRAPDRRAGRGGSA